MANQARTATKGPAIGELHEVRGVFASSEQMQEAIQRLSVSGFDRADLSVPEAARTRDAIDTGIRRDAGRYGG